MLVSTIALYGTEYKECDVDYIKLNQISWLKYNTMADGNEIYYIILNDSDVYNKIANDILHINVIGMAFSDVKELAFSSILLAIICFCVNICLSKSLFLQHLK